MTRTKPWAKPMEREQTGIEKTGGPADELTWPMGKQGEEDVKLNVYVHLSEALYLWRDVLRRDLRMNIPSFEALRAGSSVHTLIQASV
jgi:hypothetical protein